MFRRLVEDLLYLFLPMKCMMKCPFSSLKVEMEFRVILQNHALAGPLSVVWNALYIISLGTPYKCMRVLNNSK